MDKTFNKENYKVVIGGGTRRDRWYTVKDENGKTNAMAYETEKQAQKYINACCENDKDPMQWNLIALNP